MLRAAKLVSGECCELDLTVIGDQQYKSNWKDNIYEFIQSCVKRVSPTYLSLCDFTVKSSPLCAICNAS